MCLLRHTISLPSGRGGSQTARKWSEIFFRVFKPIFLRKGRQFFSQMFLAKKISHWPSNFLATHTRWVFAQLFQAIATTAMGQLNLQGGDVNPCIVRDVASGSMQLQPTAFFVGTLSTQNSEILRWKNGIFFVFFSFCDFGGTISSDRQIL